MNGLMYKGDDTQPPILNIDVNSGSYSNRFKVL